MAFISLAEAGKRWGISGYAVADLCRQGYIEGAAQKDGIWIVPAHAEKPAALKNADMTVLADAVHLERLRGNMSNEHVDFWSSIAEKITVKAGAFFSTPQAPSPYISCIAKGLLRGYLIGYNGNEVTIYFGFDSQLMDSYAGIVLGVHDGLYIQALEDTVLFGVTRDAYMKRWETDESLKESCQILQEASFLRERERTIALITKDAATRYADLLRYHKEMGFDTARIKDKYIASYLGIAPESLSRIKKNIT